MQPNEITIWGITLPTVIAAALMGSALTLLGVFLQNLFENCRTDKKLQHEAEEKEKDRKFHAKREIYLNAAEEIAKAARFLMRFSEVYLSQAEHSALLVGYNAAIAKVHLVGNLKTIRALVEANECFQSQSLRLNKIRAPLQQRAEQLKAIEARLNEDFQSQKNVVSRFEQIQRANQGDPELSKLTEQYQLLQQRIAKAQEDRTTINRETYQGSLQLFGECRKAIADYSEKLRRVNVVAREELSLSFGSSNQEYLDLMQKTSDKIDSELAEFVSGLLTPKKQEAPKQQ